METTEPAFIERRSAPRARSAIRTYFVRDQGYIRGSTRDYSRSGVFMQLSPSIELPLDSQSVVIFAIESANIVRLLRYSVMVRRESRSGYGLEFNRPLWSTAIFRRR